MGAGGSHSLQPGLQTRPTDGDASVDRLASSQTLTGSTPINNGFWYALWTRSRHEKLVRDRLSDSGIEIFLPTIARWSHWKDRKKQIEWPLFPGYCFARLSVAEMPQVRACDGVASIVGVNGDPSPVSDREIEDVRRLLDTQLAADPCPLVNEGATVVVTHGPLKGVTGRLTRKGAHARLVISIDLIGRAVSVQVHAADVRAA